MAGVNGDEKMEMDPESLTELTQLLEKHGLNPEVIKKIEEIHKKDPECLKSEDLDDRALDALKDFPVEHALDILDQFKESSLGHVTNKSSYLCGVMKAYRQEYRVHKKGPDEAKIKEILERTKYPLEVTTGQRKYGGPPPDYEGEDPGPGQEVFCGKLPKDVYEDELIPLFEKCGKIWDLRIMMNPLEGQNKGYCFITFCDKKSADNAVAQVNDYEIRKDKKLKCNISIANTRLFVGNIPKSKTEKEIEEEFNKFCDGLRNVIVYKCADNNEWKNRGFAFLDFDSHKNASAAKRKMLPSPAGRRKVWQCDIIVDWADPQEEPDEETMMKVKVLYVSNLTNDVTEEVLKEKFSKYGELERVKKLQGYAFIHFEKREDAENALKNVLIDTEIGKNSAEVSLAKPQSENAQKKKEMRKKTRGRMPPGMHMFMGRPPFGPDRRGGRFGRPHGPGQDFGDYDMYGGYHDHQYRGGYMDPYSDYPFEDFGDHYWGGGGGFRGGPRGRGAMRGKGMRGGPGMLRGPRGRGMPAPRGRSGMPARGGPPMRGGRGARGGGGDAKPLNRGGGKRKAGGDHIQGGGKRRNVQDYNNQNWGEAPIAQQPLQQSSYNYEGDDSQWYTDSFGGQNWN